MHTTDPCPVPLKELHPKLFVYDIIYNRTTPLIKYCRHHHIHCATGLGMLLHQGTQAFELWTGVSAPVSVMQTALQRSLRHRTK